MSGDREVCTDHRHSSTTWGTWKALKDLAQGPRTLTGMSRPLRGTLAEPYLKEVPIWTRGAEPQEQLAGIEDWELTPPTQGQARLLELGRGQGSTDCQSDPAYRGVH